MHAQLKKHTESVQVSNDARKTKKTNKETPAMHEAILTSEGGGGGGGCSNERTNDDRPAHKQRT